MEKRTTNLTVEDLALHPVWEYREDEGGEIVASPVPHIPVDSLRGRLIGCQVTLNNGQGRWAALSNIDLHNETSTSQFLTLSVMRGDKWFFLARYFDVDYGQRGPIALAAFLGLPLREVFPISYEITRFVVGATIPTAGLIREVPLARLTEDELIALSMI